MVTDPGQQGVVRRRLREQMKRLQISRADEALSSRLGDAP